MTLQNSVYFAFALAVAATAQADLVLDLRLDDASRSRSVTSGDSAFVDLFLVDTDASSSMSVFGLSGGGGKILAAGTGTAAGTASLAAAGPGFTGFVTSPVPGLTVPGIASIIESAPFLGFVPAFPTGAGVTALATLAATEILLGRFDVNVTGGAGDTLTLTADRLIDINGNTDGLGNDLDGLAAFINSGATESVTLSINATAAVPEPSSLLVASLLGAGYVLRRRRRKNEANSPTNRVNRYS